MSVFKRLGNLARGKLKELENGLDDFGRGPDPRPSSPETEPAEPSGAESEDSSDPEAMLRRLHASGLLTDEELERKLVDLRNARPARSTPMKRHL